MGGSVFAERWLSRAEISNGDTLLQWVGFIAYKQVKNMSTMSYNILVERLF